MDGSMQKFFEGGGQIQKKPSAEAGWNGGLGLRGLEQARKHFEDEMKVRQQDGSTVRDTNTFKHQYVIEGVQNGEVVFRENSFGMGMPENCNYISNGHEDEVNYFVVAYN